MYSFFKFCSLEPTCQRPNKPLRRFSQNKDCCTKRICQLWCCVSQRYFHSSQSHWRNWSACSVKRRRPWSSRNNSSSSMGRKTSSVIIPNPRGISDVVIYKHILRLKVFLFGRKTYYCMEKLQCIDLTSISVWWKDGFFIMTSCFCAEGNYMWNEANGFNKWSQISWIKFWNQRNQNLLVYILLNCIGLSQRERERDISYFIYQFYIFVNCCISYDDKCEQRINLYHNENSNVLLKLLISNDSQQKLIFYSI